MRYASAKNVLPTKAQARALTDIQCHGAADFSSQTTIAILLKHGWVVQDGRGETEKYSNGWRYCITEAGRDALNEVVDEKEVAEYLNLRQKEVELEQAAKQKRKEEVDRVMRFVAAENPLEALAVIKAAVRVKLMSVYSVGSRRAADNALHKATQQLLDAAKDQG